MITCKLLVEAPLGLHARAAAKLVRVAGAFQSKVRLRRVDGGAAAIGNNTNNEGVDAKSILSVLMLAATCGTQLEATAEGIDEEAAMNAMVNLFAERFGETKPGSAK